MLVFCYGDEEKGHRACTSKHLTTANQSEIRKAYIEICERIKPYLNDEMMVLELVCGTGYFSFMLGENVKSREAADFSENMIHQAKAAQKSCASIKNLRFSVQDATNHPYEDGSFAT